MVYEPYLGVQDMILCIFIFIVRIKLYYDGEEDILDAFNEFVDYIKEETLAAIYEQKKNDNVVDINGYDVNITIEKN